MNHFFSTLITYDQCQRNYYCVVNVNAVPTGTLSSRSCTLSINIITDIIISVQVVGSLSAFIRQCQINITVQFLFIYHFDLNINNTNTQYQYIEHNQFKLIPLVAS